MNEQTRQLIEKLADKFGTTAEHLWAVLVRQAPISSTAETIALCVYAVLMIWSYRIVREKTKDGGDWNDSCGSIAMPWGIWGFAMFSFLMTLCCSISGILAGFFNPEYFALKEILNK